MYIGAAFGGWYQGAWVLGTNEIVFYMEQLKKLHIQGAEIESLQPKDFATSLPSKKTALKDLALINCDLSPDTLGRILAFPESLTHFTMKGTCLDVSGDFTSCGHSNLNGVSLYKFIERIEQSSSAGVEYLDFDLCYGEDRAHFDYFELFETPDHLHTQL